MGAAARRVTENKDEKQGIDEQDMFHRVVFCLAALTRGLCSRVLGANDAPFGAVMGTRGDNHGGSVRLRDTEPLHQGGEEGGQEDMHPLMGVALAHAEHTPMPHLERRGFQINQNEAQPIFRCRERTGFIHGKLAGGPGLPIEAPHGPSAWNAASKGGTSVGNASRVTRVQSRHAVGRDGTAVNRTLAIRGASLRGRPSRA